MRLWLRVLKVLKGNSRGIDKDWSIIHPSIHPSCKVQWVELSPFHSGSLMGLICIVTPIHEEVIIFCPIYTDKRWRGNNPFHSALSAIHVHTHTHLFPPGIVRCCCVAVYYTYCYNWIQVCLFFHCWGVTMCHGPLGLYPLYFCVHQKRDTWHLA